MPEDAKARKSNPLPNKSRMADAAWLLKLICGSVSEKFAPAIDDSRELRALSRAVQNPETFAQLKQGATVEHVAREVIPSDQRVLEGLVAATPHLEDCNIVLTKAPLSPHEATRLHPTAEKVARLAISIRNTLKSQGDEN
jgi:hypothetical protein